MRSAAPLLALTLTACTSGLNLFSIEDDRQLGAELAAEIEANPQDYPLLDREEWPDAYAHLDRIAGSILDSGEVNLAGEFDWEFHLVDDSEVLNAFAAPGGYVYVYTGLIEYLDREDELAGVLGHEIAHADLRHSTETLTQVYGAQVLLAVLFGQDRGIIADVAAGLATLSFSRAHETEADEFSVRYLCETPYAADGAAGFFETIDDATPEFLSTHPSPDGRVDAIEGWAADLGCSTTDNPNGQYPAFLASLP